MGSSILNRSVAASLEVRADGDGRTLCGIAVPYDTPTTINDWLSTYTESFSRGAFRNAIANPRSVKLLSQHDRGANPLGVATVLRDDHAGLYSEFHVSRTQAGDETLELAKDGALSFSVGFVPVDPAPRSFEDDGAHVVRKLVDLREVSTVTWPAYQAAKISGVRSALGALATANEIREAEGLPPLAPDELERLQGALLLAREGKTLSKETQGKLREALTHVGNANDVLAGMLPDDAAGSDEADAARAAEVARIRHQIRVLRMRQKIVAKGLSRPR